MNTFNFVKVHAVMYHRNLWRFRHAPLHDIVLCMQGIELLLLVHEYVGVLCTYIGRKVWIMVKI